jgi:FdrA protein
LTVLEPFLGQIGGNVSGLPAETGHCILDLGEEEYTRGRPHPMVDLRVRIDMLAAVAARPEVGCVLMDVVLGYGSHPDPAAELAPVISDLTARVPVVIRVCGTAADPQNAPRQESILQHAGALVARSNAAAARLAARAVQGD